MDKIKAFVARDKSGYLGLYLFNKPQQLQDTWLPGLSATDSFCELPEKMCQNVTFKNSPKEIEIELP